MTLRVSDQSGLVKDSTITINVENSLAMSAPTGVTVTAGKPLTYQITATGGKAPYVFSSSAALPSWASVDGTTGAVVGTPPDSGQTTSQVTNFQVYVSGSLGRAVGQNSQITVAPALQLAGAVNPNQSTGKSVVTSTAFSAMGGTAPYTWSVTNMSVPAGASTSWLTISSNGVLTGTIPSVEGTYSFTVNVTDSTGTTKSSVQSFSAITPVEPLTAAITLNGVTYAGGCSVNVKSGSATIVVTVSGGVASYTISDNAGNTGSGFTITRSQNGNVYNLYIKRTGSSGGNKTTTFYISDSASNSVTPYPTLCVAY